MASRHGDGKIANLFYSVNCYNVGVAVSQIDSEQNCALSAGILQQFMWARNRVGIWLSYRPARLADSIPGHFKRLKIPTQCNIYERS